ncbi:hypothetical protein KWG64_06205 [Rahnella sp. PD12R]|uniref:hypothetical protein n=1 Tax=Rahnella sp. PD12R TaxID=2855688 RepID=UPI001C43C299|nr:hypothetical protein [Rahnella sp. PD12R]MBV6817532.1 hypothetical protein [Rahnella sp. PD12R]
MSRVIILVIGDSVESFVGMLRAGRSVDVSSAFSLPKEAYFSVEAKTEKQSEAWQEKQSRNAGFARAKRAAKKRGRAR